LPEIDASVSTRVVSWNDAAEMNESVDSDAFVIPSSSGRPVAGRSAVGDHALVLFHEAEAIDLLLDEELRIAHVLDLHPAHHLPDDHLDVLVVDVHALQPVDLLDLVDEIRVQRLLAEPCRSLAGFQLSTEASTTSQRVHRGCCSKRSPRSRRLGARRDLRRGVEFGVAPDGGDWRAAQPGHEHRASAAPHRAEGMKRWRPACLVPARQNVRLDVLSSLRSVRSE
jgi:hypothetical protein